MPNLGYGSRGEGLSVAPIGNITGFSVEGYGQKLTLPKGRNGNDKDVVVTIKAWYAPGIKTAMLIEVADSRVGTTRISLTDIKRTEPETALFNMPPGYHTVDEQENFSLRLAAR